MLQVVNLCHEAKQGYALWPLPTRMISKEQPSTVEAAGDAFAMAQKWLRQKGLRPDISAQTASDMALNKPRTPGMGLGATYLPHHKGLATAAQLEKHLMRRVSADDEHGGHIPDSNQQLKTLDSIGASSDEDDAGRGSTFSAKPKVQSSRQEYAIQPSVGVRKPKKRKKKKKNKLPEKLPVAGHHDHRRIAR